MTIAWGGAASDVPVPGDYDGDGQTDVAIYRPATGTWYILKSSTNYVGGMALSLGGGTDIPMAGDYDGDGKTDIGVFHVATGTWQIIKSSDGSTMMATWGTGSDVPFPRHP